MTASASATTRVVLDRVTARVFCHGSSGGGGNPVTVFASSTSHPLSSSTQERLAKACEWESVMVSTSSSSSSTETPNSSPNKPFSSSEMAFYMPSGEAVSFCAHAALGGAFAASSLSTPTMTENSLIDFAFRSAMMPETEHNIQLSNDIDEESNSASSMSGTARLHMVSTYEEAPVSHPPALYRLLRSHLGVGSEALVTGTQYPSLLNASIARPKTLVHMNSVDALMNAKQPKVAIDPKQRNSFAAACDAIDSSTGIYVYANRKNEAGAWECRQFPRASGYPEDPATGIAAAALAGSLYRQGIYWPVYKFYQGTAMQRPSLIEVLDLNIRGSDASFTLQGRVEIDSRETIEIEEKQQ